MLKDLIAQIKAALVAHDAAKDAEIADLHTKLTDAEAAEAAAKADLAEAEAELADLLASLGGAPVVTPPSDGSGNPDPTP